MILFKCIFTFLWLVLVWVTDERPYLIQDEKLEKIESTFLCVNLPLIEGSGSTKSSLICGIEEVGRMDVLKTCSEKDKKNNYKSMPIEDVSWGLLVLSVVYGGIQRYRHGKNNK